MHGGGGGGGCHHLGLLSALGEYHKCKGVYHDFWGMGLS